MGDGPATRIVRCCHCRGMMRVAAKALSVFCPHCQKRATLESLRIVGSHPGRKLATCGDILVEPASQLNLEILANNVVVRGRVNGCVSANHSIEVASTGRVIGDIRAARIIVHDGGVIQGRCEMLPSRPAPPTSSEPREQQAAMDSQGAERMPAQPKVGPPQQIRPIQLD